MNPIISVIVANYNGELFLAEALHSILGQSFTQLEVLLVDDNSTDGSLEIAAAIAETDSRLHILRLSENCGPAGARNYGLNASCGKWIAIVDSDDFIHPERLRRLLDAAEAENADIIADDQLIFDNANHVDPKRLLSGKLASEASWITAEQYVKANCLFTKSSALGYLKPLIRKSLLVQHEIQYNINLKNAEDYDLILRLLVRGARFRILPEMLYFYRRHSGSISYRFASNALKDMMTADNDFRSWAGPHVMARLHTVLDKRIASLHTATAAESSLSNLKHWLPWRAFVTLASKPSAIPILLRLLTPQALRARMRRLTDSAPFAITERQLQPTICVLSRQRLIEGTNGSTAYLLSLCRTLRKSGFRLQLICPSPRVLGRVPLLQVAGDGDVFDEISICGTYRIGHMFIARDPRVFVAASVAIADRIARRVGFSKLSSLVHPAPYAVGAAWTVEDYLFVAKTTGGVADIVLADYGFLTPGIPYASRPGAASAVVMHDLFSSRTEGFNAIRKSDSVASLDAKSEAALLSKAKLVIAIQQDEAATARRMLPEGHSVVVAPIALQPVPKAQAGQGGGILFVGSGTAPNVDAMCWFLAEIWPLVCTRHPSAQLTLAGTVCNELSDEIKRPGVVLLGRVADLDPLYRRADIVIAPLRVGSGLKIKLVEALAHGKPVVATSVAAQGVEQFIAGAVALADSPQDFVNAIVRLLSNPQERKMRALASLAVAESHFSPWVAYGEVVGHLQAQYATVISARKNLSKHRPVNTSLFITVRERTTGHQASKSLPFITIVVPTLNEARYIKPCLTSLISQYPADKQEILVMDGGSSDDTCKIVSSFCESHSSVRLIHNPQRLQSAALNLAASMASASSKILVRADAHAHYAQDFIKKCVSALAETGATSVVVPMYTQALSSTGLQGAIAAAQSCRLGNGGAAHRTKPVSGFVEHGHHAAFDLGFFRSIGGYDENFTHNEDAELDVRARKAGGRIWMCAEGSVIYYPRERLSQLALQYYRHGSGRARTLRKHHKKPQLRQIVPVGILASCIAGVVTAPFAPAEASLVLIYPAICLLWAIAESIRKNEPRLTAAGLALMTMHLSWAVGFLIGLGRARSSAKRATLHSHTFHATALNIRANTHRDATPAFERR